MSSIVHVHHIDEVLLLTQTMSSLEWFVPQLPHAQYYMYISITQCIAIPQSYAGKHHNFLCLLL